MLVDVSYGILCDAPDSAAVISHWLSRAQSCGDAAQRQDTADRARVARIPLDGLAHPADRLHPQLHEVAVAREHEEQIGQAEVRLVAIAPGALGAFRDHGRVLGSRGIRAEVPR